MSNLNNAYYHGISAKSFKEIEDLSVSLRKLKKILNSGYIYSLRKQGINNISYATLAGLDQVCICKDMRSKINSYLYNYYHNPADAYSQFVLYYYSIILKSNLPEVIKPKLAKFQKASLETGNTDLFDEWRVKDEIDIEKYSLGVGVPFLAVAHFLCEKNSFSFDKLQETLKRQYDFIKNYLISLNYNLPIIDSELKEEINNLDQEYFEKLEEQSHLKKILVNN